MTKLIIWVATLFVEAFMIDILLIAMKFRLISYDTYRNAVIRFKKTWESM